MYMRRNFEREFVWLLHDLTTKLSAAEQAFIAIFGQTLESLPNADTPGSNGVRHAEYLLYSTFGLQSVEEREIHVSSYSDLSLCLRKINIASDRGLAVGVATLWYTQPL